MAILTIPNLKAKVDSLIKANGLREITGTIHNEVLNDVIDSLQFYSSNLFSSYVKKSYDFSNFLVASTEHTIEIDDILDGYKNFNIIAVVKTAFVGVGISAVVLDLGTNEVGEESKYTAFDPYNLDVPANTNYDVEANDIKFGINRKLTMKITSTGANLAALTAGNIDIYYEIKQI